MSVKEKNRLPSFIETQPSVHFSLISHFLSHSETIKLFRSSTQIYSIPLKLLIFLNYFNELDRNKKSFNFTDFLTFNSNKKNFIFSEIKKNFRFFINI